jgi:hypothetical protein
LRLPQTDKQAFLFHKLIKYRYGDTSLSMTTQTDTDSYSYSGSSYDTSNKKDYNQRHSCTCCCWHMYCTCSQLTGPQKCSLRNWILITFSENLCLVISEQATFLSLCSSRNRTSLQVHISTNSLHIHLVFIYA